MCMCSCKSCSDVTEVLPVQALRVCCVCFLPGLCVLPELGISLMKAVEGRSDCLHCGTLRRAASAGLASPFPCPLAVIHLLRLSWFHRENPCLRDGMVVQAWTSAALLRCSCPGPVPRRAPWVHGAAGSRRLGAGAGLLLSSRWLDFLKREIRNWELVFGFTP